MISLLSLSPTTSHF